MSKETIDKAAVVVTQRMLTLQLRELESDGVIRRKVYAEVRPKVEYSLTDFGLSLKPILLLMGDWGTQYREGKADPIHPCMATFSNFGPTK